ncbi:MAG: hypothetical protein KatS3mg087_0619 [Patescibacteria group bacterium]|nr:MAG: hypothetical protein KatS3mg087_0619 [Patescibacteria group bacterium]
MEIASIWLDARVNLNSVVRDLQQLNTKQFAVNVRVDDRALTGLNKLNKHLDKKVAHLKQVQSYFNSNPLRVRVDDREVTNLNQKLQNINKQIGGSIELDVIYKTQDIRREFKEAAKEFGDELEKAGDRVSKSIKKSSKGGGAGSLFSAITAAPRTIARGFYEGIGITYAEQISKGFIKGIEGKFNTSLERMGQKTSEKVLQVGQRTGDAVLKKMGLPEGTAGVKQKIDAVNRVLQDLFPVDELERKLARVEARFDKFLDSLTRFKSSQENIANLIGLGQEIASIGQIPFDKIKRDRASQVSEIAKQIKLDQKQNPIKVDIPEQSERVVIASGGFAGAKGESGKFVAEKLQMLLGEKSAVIPVNNQFSDVSASVGDIGPLRWSIEAAFKTLSIPAKQKINPDAVDMARQAFAAYQQDPTKPIRLVGYSYGGQVANDALEILKALGVPDVKAIGIGSPSFGKLSANNSSEFQSVLGEGDGVNRLQELGAFFGGKGKGLKMTSVVGHELSSYLADPESQEIILKQIEGSQAEARKALQDPNAFRLLDYKKNIEKMLGSVEQLLTDPVSDPSLQKQLMSANLQAIAQTKEDLDELLSTLSNEVIGDFGDYYQALVEAENVLSDLVGTKKVQQPEIKEASPDESAKNIVKQKADLEQLMLTLNKKDVIEPIAQELGIKNIRNTKKQDLVSKIIETSDPDALKKLLPYTTPPSQEVIAEAASRVKMPSQELKKVVQQQRQSIESMMSKNVGRKTGSEMGDISSAIEREYQIVISALSQGVASDSKAILESAKLELGKLRAKAIREATQQIQQELQNRQKQGLVQPQTDVQGLASVQRGWIDKIKSLQINISKQASDNLSRNYELVIKEVAKVSKKSLTEKDIPKLVVDDAYLKEIGAKAYYNIKENKIIIDKQIAEILDGSTKELDKFIEQLRPLIHEARHGAQLDFGKRNLVDVSVFGMGVTPIPQQALSHQSRYYAERSVQIAKQTSPLISRGVLNAIRSVEQDAYAFDEIFTEKIVNNVAATKITPFTEMQRSLSKLIDPLKSSALEFDKGYKKVQSFSDGLAEGVSIVDEFTKNAIEGFKSFSQYLPGGQNLIGLANAMQEVRGATGPLLRSLMALTALSIVINLFRDFGKESLEVAAKMEALQQRVSFASGSKRQGRENVLELRRQSTIFGLNRQQTLEQGSSFLAATRGTLLEGEQSLKVLESLNQSSRVYNLTLDQQQRAQVALQQIVAKGVVSQEELRGQLSEAIPGAAQVAARAYGVTVQELNKMIAAGLDGVEFTKKFADQLGAETAGGLAGALNTTQATITRFDNSLLSLKETTGNALLPLQNLSLTALTTGINALNKALPVLLAVLGAISLRITVLSGQALASLIAQMIASRTAIFAMGAALRATGAAIATAAKQFLVFTVVVAAIAKVGNLFRDLSGDIGKQVEQVKQLREEYKKLTGEVSNLQQSRPNDFQTGIERFKRGVSDFFTFQDSKKQIEDSAKKIAESRNLTSEIISSASGSATTKAIIDIKEIDKQLETLQIKRRALVQSNPGDKEGLRDLKKQEDALLASRNDINKIPDNAKKQLMAQSEAIKAQIEYLEDLKTSFPLYGKEVESVNYKIGQLKDDLEGVQEAQDNLNKAIGEGSNAFANMQKNIKGIADDLSDASDRMTISSNKYKVAILNQVAAGKITPGQEQKFQSDSAIASMVNQLKKQMDAIAQAKALLDTDENRERMKAFGVDYTTGKAKLITRAESASNVEDKYLLEQLANLQQQKLDISNLATQIATARADAQRQLIESTKQVAEYYRGIERQAKEQSIEMKRLSVNTAASSAQNRLRGALLDGYDDIVSQFVDSIIDSIEQQKQISDRALDAQNQLLQNENQLQDALMQGVELSRSLPGQLPTIPVEIDLTNVYNNADVQALNEELQNSIYTTQDLESSLYDVKDSINKGVDLTEELNRGFDLTTQTTEETFNELTNVSLGITKNTDLVGNLNQLSQEWNNTLGRSQEQVQGVQGLFQCILEWINKLIVSTQSWISSLSSGIQQATKGVSGWVQEQWSNITGGGQQSGSTSSSGVIPPVGNAPVTSGYGPRKAPKPGASTWHHGIDYGVPIGTPVKAPTSGTVSYVGQYGGGGLTVKLKSIDQQGRQIEQAFLHLSKATVKVGDTIQQGQEIAKSGNTGISSGPHLDWRIKINGQYVNPSDFLKSQISIGVSQSPSTSSPSTSQATHVKLNAGAIAKKYGAQSLLIADTQGKIISSYNANQSPASPASTIKLVIGDLVSQRFKPGQSIGVDSSAIAEGDAGRYKAGQSFSALELVTRMLRDSDNTATNLLIKSLGGLNRVNELAKQSGYRQTHIGNLLSIPGAKGFSNRSTAIDTTTAMVRILGSNTQLGQIAENAIRANRDFGFKGESGGKIGNNSKVIGNVGIVNIGGKEYLVTSYANVNGNQISNRGIIKNITNDVSKSLEQARSQSFAGGGGKYSSSSSKLSGDFLQEVSALSARLGIPPEWLIAVMGFETGGTYSPSKRNPLSGATGLIQFMPSTARSLGTSTNALAKMSQSQQLKFVEKYLSPYKGRFNSLEDLYMSVLMPAGVGKGANYKLPGWAYRQNSGLDINKDGAISAAEATSKVRDYLPKGAIAPQINQAPNKLQSQVAQGMDAIRQIYAQKAEQITKNADTDINKLQKEFIRANERALRQFEQGGRSIDDQRRSSARSVQDLAYEANSNPTPQEQFSKKAEDINRRYQDEIINRNREIEDIQRRITKTQQSLNELNEARKQLPPGFRVNNDRDVALEDRLKKDTEHLVTVQNEVKKLTELRSQALESAKKLFDREDQQRRGQAGFAQEKVEIEVLQGKLQILQEIQKLNPYDERVKTIPALQEQISLKQNDLQLDQDLFQIEQELYSHSIVQEEYDKRAEAIKKANIQRQNEIALTRQQAEEQQRLLELQRNLELRGQLNEGRSQNLQIQQELAQRNFSRSPSLDTSALKAIQEESINAQIEAQRIAYEKQMLELREQLRKSPEIANQTKGLMLNAAFLNQSRLTQFNNSKQDLDGQLRSQQIQKQLDRLSLEEVINAPSINLQKMRAQRIQDTGGNIFQANALNRNAAIQEEEIRYKQEILSLEKQINEARLAGQNIDDSQVKEMYASLEKIHGINLENVNRQFKTFGATLNEVAQGAVSGLAQSLTDLILKGGSLSDVLDNLANTVLSGVLNAGLNSVFGSLFGGLFYDGGLVPNYAGGGIHRAMAKEKSMSGREPMLAVVHRGEMLIPAKRMKELNAIGLGEKQLLGYADGGIVGWEKNENISAMQSMSKSAVSDRTSGTTQVNVSYQIERINERNYVDEETFRQGMKKAAEAGANKGYARMSRDINKSTSFRRNAGF